MWYIEKLNNLYPKTSAGNMRHIAASESSVAHTRGYLFYIKINEKYSSAYTIIQLNFCKNIKGIHTGDCQNWSKWFRPWLRPE